MYQPDGQTRAALANTETGPDYVRITEQLDPALWQSVARVLTMLGGTYQTNRSTYTFSYDPRSNLKQVIQTGVCRSPAAAEGYVGTPDDLAEELTTYPYSDLARMPKGSRVLEPSAGDGRIVRAILDANDEVSVVAVEPNTERAALIGEHGDRLTVVGSTFEAYAAGAAAGGELFDAVVMNPPFAVPGRPKLWIDHVMLAWNLLEPGGRLVAVVPSGFADNGSRQVTDLRALVKEFGGWNRLPQGTFLPDTAVRVCVIWLARPVPRYEGQPPYVFRHYADAVEPVRVAYPWLTTRAVTEAPVQVWKDTWDGDRDRVLRYRSQCWGCGWLLWEFDGNNDNALGNHAAHSCLDAGEYDKVGPTVGLCFNCWNTAATREAALKVAMEIWSRPPTKNAAVSVWSVLLRRGGFFPASELERERYARVQAAMRIVWGLDEHASEDELIDAREANPFRGGPDRLAAQYLRAYADRLDPDGDLDDADRAALLWREHPDAPPISLDEAPDPWGGVLEQLALFPQ
jgi:hypothetical protein